MTPDTKREVDRLFEEVSALGEAERELRLQTVDKRLAEEVRRLVELLPSAEGLFAHLELRLEAGRMVGTWRLIAPLGRGGMGEVWRAERADGEYQDQVAIKFLATAALAGGWARFQREKQILASLKHPGIARMIDAGTTAAGVPWLAMELVDGRPITEFAAELEIRDRVRLIAELCEAIEYAHQRLIVHRDLKPSNILVTAAGRPKLLDFGIALDLERRESTTAPLARMLSVEWASPEQLRGEGVSTASDVLSLGRLLGALLAGRTGLEEKQGAALWEAVLRAELPPPSALSGDARLKGDLDSIVLKATAARVEDRYGSAAAFRHDLENWLALRPVQARRWTRGYVTKRFVQRHWKPGLVAAGIVVGVALAFNTVQSASERALAEARKAAAAERVALARGHEAEAARVRAEAMRTESEQQRMRTEEARTQSARRFEEAWKLSRAVIFDYQQQLRAAGVAASLRAQMVKDSIALLDKLSESGVPAALSLDVARAYIELANATGVRAAGNIGDVQQGKSALAKADKLLRDFLREAPQHREARRRLADVLVLRADLEQRGVSAEARHLLEQLERESPQDPQVLWSLGNLHFWAAAGEPSHVGKVRDFERSLGYFERLRKLEPGNRERWATVSLLHKQLGSEYKYLKNSDKVCQHGAAAVEMDTWRLRAEPHSVRVQMDLNTSQGVSADCVQMRDGLGAFLKAYEVVLEGRRMLLARDPENELYRSRLGAALLKMGHAYVNSGRAADALPLVEESQRMKAEAIHPELVWLRAAVLEQVGRIEEACVAFAAAMNSRPEVVEWYQGTATQLQQRCRPGQ